MNDSSPPDLSITSSFTIVCRTSRLAVVQAERARALMLRQFPAARIRIITKQSAGDKQPSAPLYTLEGRDFFTKDIDEYLLSGEADFAVHSLKDLSLERTEDAAVVSAIFERDDPRDVALFSHAALEKLSRGEPLTLGTSSLRRMELAPRFLEQALPRHNAAPKPHVRCEPMRGNVDSRLRQLAEGAFDGVILAAAGINRLLAAPEHHDHIALLLSGFRMMMLPLVECPPAPGQGALIVEARASNSAAAAVVERLRNAALEEQISSERLLLREFGGGCHQRFGAVNIEFPQGSHLCIINGVGSDGASVEDMRFAVPEPFASGLAGKRVFAASDMMTEFFTTEFADVADDFHLAEEAVFVSHHRAAKHEAVLRELRRKRVWTAGTRTWFELAKRGVWVEGCSDGFGFGFVADVLSTPLVKLHPRSLHILTNTEAAEDWQREGFRASGLYTMQDNLSAGVIAAVREADVCFWTSFGQYRACHDHLKKDVIHACPAGRTAAAFRAHGIEPVLFPSIKAFLLWQRARNKEQGTSTK
jgi:hydroxymethylbilane synthase